GYRGNLNISCTPRNRQDPRSSGERTGGSPNPWRVKPAGVASGGLEASLGTAAAVPPSSSVCSEDVWKASPETVRAGSERRRARGDECLSSAGHEMSGVKLAR